MTNNTLGSPAICNFDDHANAPLQFGVHLPIEHGQGFTRSQWTSPSGDYSHRIALASPPWSSTAATQQTQQKNFLRYGTSRIRKASKKRHERDPLLKSFKMQVRRNCD